MYVFVSIDFPQHIYLEENVAYKGNGNYYIFSWLCLLCECLYYIWSNLLCIFFSLPHLFQLMIHHFLDEIFLNFVLILPSQIVGTEIWKKNKNVSLSFINYLWLLSVSYSVHQNFNKRHVYINLSLSEELSQHLSDLSWGFTS